MTMTANGLAKLLEEMGELTQEVAKKLAYFHTDEHPDGKGPLSERIQAEAGDVMAAIDFVAEQFCLNNYAIQLRRVRKLELFRQWHAETGNNSQAVDRERSHEQ